MCFRAVSSPGYQGSVVMVASALAADDPYGRLALALAPVSSSGGWYRQWQLMTPMVGWL